MISSRLQAYAMLTHHALNELYSDDATCCPHDCAPCGALQYLDNEGILDVIVKTWERYDDGTEIEYDNPEKAPGWIRDGKVDTDWLHRCWEYCESHRDGVG